MMAENNIVELKTVQSGALRTMVEVLKDVLTDVNITFTEEGMKVMAMDGSHVALIHLKLDAENFELYSCKEEVTVGVCMLSWFKLMKTVSNADTVSIYIANKNRDEMGLVIANADKNTQTCFKLKLLEIDKQELNIPDVEINCVLSMPSNDFQRLCRDMINIADNVSITSNKEGLKFACDGDFARQETCIGHTNHGLNFIKQWDQEISGTYSLKYINLFTKSTSLCNTIELYLKQDYPLILKYSVANLGEVRFCLAPKSL
jgi:proliferating cell nuclear antigen